MYVSTEEKLLNKNVSDVLHNYLPENSLLAVGVLRFRICLGHKIARFFCLSISARANYQFSSQTVLLFKRILELINNNEATLHFCWKSEMGSSNKSDVLLNIYRNFKI